MCCGGDGGWSSFIVESPGLGGFPRDPDGGGVAAWTWSGRLGDEVPRFAPETELFRLASLEPPERSRDCWLACRMLWIRPELTRSVMRSK